MKKVVRLALPAVAFAALSLTSCKKCEECHYDGPNNQEVSLGEYCGDDLEEMEKNGNIEVDSVMYTVHCAEH
jgi:hypothetical protein